MQLLFTGPCALPFGWETVDVHIMLPLVIHKVSVVADLWLHAAWKRSQVHYIMVSDGIV